jgi:hypothetical protein
MQALNSDLFPGFYRKIQPYLHWIKLSLAGFYGLIYFSASGFAQSEDLMQLWALNGSPISTLEGGQGYGVTGKPGVSLVADGSGGSFMVWEDLGSSAIMVQKTNADGSASWPVNGIALTGSSGSKFSPRAISDGNGGLIIGWVDGRVGYCSVGFQGDCKIYAQHIDSTGLQLWSAGGMPVVTANGNQGASGIAMVTDGAGGAFLAWEDARLCCAFYAQHINAQGQPVWIKDGIQISTTPSIVLGPIGEAPRLVSDGQGGVFIGWLNNQVNPLTQSPPFQIQRLNAGGQSLWSAGGITVGYPSRTNSSRLIADGVGGVISIFSTIGQPDNLDNIAAQRLDANGNLLWASNGVSISAAPSYQFYPDAVSDGAGGAIVTWYDQRNGSGQNIYAQRVNATGTTTWAANGIPITNLNDQFSPRTVTDGSGGAFIFWQDCRNYPDGGTSCGYNLDLFGQRLDSQGNSLWPQNGTSVSQAPGNQSIEAGEPYTDMYAVIADQQGGAIIAWPDGRERTCQELLPDCQLYAQRITPVSDQQINFQSISFPTVSHLQFGDIFTLTASATSNLPVSFSSLTPSICAVDAVSDTTVSNLAIGICRLAADQPGNNTYLPAHQVTQSYTVTQAKQFINFPVIASQALASAPLNINPTSSSGLMVTVTSSTPATCSVNGLSIKLLASGSCQLIASQAGNSNYLAAAAVSRSFNIVSKFKQQISYTAVSPQSYSQQTVPVFVSSDSGLAVSLVSVTTGVCQIGSPPGNSTPAAVSIKSTGTCTLHANQTGNAVYLPATQQTITFTISKTTQTISFSGLNDQQFGNPTVIVNATASSGLLVSLSSLTPSICSIINKTSIKLLNSGDCSIKASQSGNIDYLPAAAVTQQFSVHPAPQTINFPAIPAKTFGMTAFNLSASASSGLAVSFSSASPTICSVNGKSVKIIAAGNCLLIANQAGSKNYLSAQIQQTVQINRAVQTIHFPAISQQKLTVKPLTVNASSSSGLNITLNTNSPSVCNVNGKLLNLLQTGICSLTASQAGNGNYWAASPVNQQFNIIK